MKPVIAERMTAVRDDGVVVFLIGMRINRWWKIHRWLPVALAMPRMMRELASRPEAGLLGSISMGTTMVQYWESAEKLLAYASDRTGAHFPAWAEFYRRVGKNGDVGIWHETYMVPRHNFESVYVNMPAHGMGTFAKLEPAHGKRARAAERLGVPPLESHTADAISGASPARNLA